MLIFAGGGKGETRKAKKSKAQLLEEELADGYDRSRDRYVSRTIRLSKLDLQENNVSVRER